MKQNHLFKRISAAILSACLAAAAFTGCSGGTAAEPTVSTTAASSDVLRVAMFWVSTTLDPADGYNGWVLSRIGAGETLVRLDENAELTRLHCRELGAAGREHLGLPDPGGGSPFQTAPRLTLPPAKRRSNGPSPKIPGRRSTLSPLRSRRTG